MKMLAHNGPRPHPHRFTALDPRIEMVPETGCWIWMGCTMKSGYGITGKGVAHRAFYEQANGPIGDGLVLDHVCRVRCCVNPSHLRACTYWENAHAPGSLNPAKKNAEKTHCSKCGGDFSVYRLTTRSPARYCKPCRAAYITQWKRERYQNDPVYRAKIRAQNNARNARKRATWPT